MLNKYIIECKGATLEIGGGSRPLPFEHINMDYQKDERVDVVHNLEDVPYPFDDEKFDTIVGIYILEHLSWRVIPDVLKEIYRILKSEGKAIFLVPNTLEQCKKIAKEGVNKETVEMLFGSQEFEPKWLGSHKMGFSPEYAKKIFEEAGFEVNVITPMPDVFFDKSGGGEGEIIPMLIPLYPACQTDMIIEAKKSSVIVTSGSYFAKKRNIMDEKHELKVKVLGGDKMQPEGLKLNIGSFTVMISGSDWLNIDILPLQNYARQHGYNFMQHDVRKPLPFEDNSIAFINTSHLIEHLRVEEGLNFLKECYRVLKKGGKIRIGTPDLKKIVDAYINNEMDKFNKIQPPQFAEASNADKVWRLIASPARQDIPAPPDHKTIYDFEALKELLEEIGFKNIRQVKYNQKYDMFPEISLYVEAKKFETEIYDKREKG